MQLIENEREKIVSEMRKHIEGCWNPHCFVVEEQIIRFDLSSRCKKEDPMFLILDRNVAGLAKIETDCFYGKQLNRKMWETHRLMAGL